MQRDTGAHLMSSETFSILLWCWRDRQRNVTQIRVLRVDTGEEVYFSDSSYLLRISTDENVLRCLIRHIASGREVYVQSSLRLREFVKACLLKDAESLSEFTTPVGSEEDVGESKSGPESAPPDEAGEGSKE
jgi:hypothetical protein